MLVNNAGITNDKLVMRMDAEDFKNVGYQFDWNLQYDAARIEK